MEPRIRRVEARDAETINRIYTHYVLETPITFDVEPWPLEKRREWVAHFEPEGRHQCFVAEEDGAVLGWACSGPFRPKAAYETSVEMSVYLAPEAIGKRLGTRLYDALLGALEGEDVRRALGGITLPNAASVALHARFGFTSVGVFSDVGRKFDRYWDVQWFEKPLGRQRGR